MGTSVAISGRWYQRLRRRLRFKFSDSPSRLSPQGFLRKTAR